MTTIVNSMTSVYQNPGQYPASRKDNADGRIYKPGPSSSPNLGLSKEPNPFEQSFSAVHPQFKNNSSQNHKQQQQQQQQPLPATITYFPPEIQNIPQPNISLSQPIPNPNFSIRNQISYNVPSPWVNSNLHPYVTSSYQASRKGIGGRKRKPTEGMDPKKIQFLERNRQGKLGFIICPNFLAALKCRLRKKKRLETTQIHRSVLEQQNMQLSGVVQELTDLRRHLKLLLHNHSHCPTYQKLIQYPY